MSYQTALSFLASKTATVELSNRSGGRVAVCPQWNGRIMTSCCDGYDSQSFGFINVPEIENTLDPNKYVNFGGEDIWTFSPLMMSFDIEHDDCHEIALTNTLAAADANGKMAEFNVSRTVTLLETIDIDSVFNASLSPMLNIPEVLFVGFASYNTIRSSDTPTIASRLRGMFHVTPDTVAVVPLLPEEPDSEKFPYRLDFFGSSPHQRIRHLPDMLLFHADGEGRCQLSVRCNGLPLTVGSLELRSGSLTLWSCQLPEKPYLPKHSDVEDMNTENFVRITNNGKRLRSISEQMNSYEINSFSALQTLYPDEGLTYRHYTLHITAQNSVLDDILQAVFGVSYKQIVDRSSL